MCTLRANIQNWAKRYRQPPEIALEAQKDLENRFNGYLQNIKKQSVALSAITGQFAKTQLAFITGNSRRAARVRAMSDEQLTEEFQMLTLIEMMQAWGHYADAVERVEANFFSAFSSFVESVLGAAAISIVFPAVHTKSLRQALVDLRRKLHPLYGTMGVFKAQLEQVRPTLSGIMVTSNERSTAALGNFSEHVRFGERLLLESEKLFNTKR